MRVSLATDLDIQAFSGSGITDYNSGVTNGIINATSDRVILTQRPSIDISEQGSPLGMAKRGRGLYYWEENGKLYIINDDEVFAATQDSTAVGVISGGTERVTILESIGTPYMIILDAENNEGWVMNAGETVTAIASNFPTTLAHGGAILDTYLFAMDEDGIIYNSNVNDPTIFGATGFITTERENDKGVYLGKHHEHLAAISTRTTEFFYDARNTTGSPLNRRQDISYNVGCANGLSVWENGDTTYFIGSNPSGQMAVYKMANFQLSIISNDTMNSYLTQGMTQDGLVVACNGLSAMGHDTLIMTIYVLTGSPTEISPRNTIIFDTKTSQWGFWNTALGDHDYFPLMAWTKRVGGQNASVSARTGEGIFHNGDILNINDKLSPIDTLLGADGVFEDGVFEADVFVGTSESNGENIDLKVRTGLLDGETSAYKFQNRETVEMENTVNSQTLTIKHSDESSNDFDAGNTVDTSNTRKEVHAGGRFMKRNYQLEYSGDEQIYIEALDIDLSIGL